MLNRFFFISDTMIPTGAHAQADEHIYFSILTDPSVIAALRETYERLSAPGSLPFTLTLDIRTPLTAEGIRFITSFLFIPSYASAGGQRVILLTGMPDLLADAGSLLSAYLSAQGFADVMITIIPSIPPNYAELTATTAPLLIRSVIQLEAYYTRLIQNGPYHNNDIFFYSADPDNLPTVLSALQTAEARLRQSNPELYASLQTNQALQKELYSLGRRYSGTEMELKHYKQYVEILRSDHVTKELQDYYTREYEILPRWYKRFGQIIKVLTGKRTFRSLFRHDVKKYKD
jgi:hypothetical protein